ncbi:transcriptional regulator, RpiR family [Candidatus Moduliflexus flocculans]|uniref:Transcriptional regulator, RpiR family n=1 Tax=Candidatus Moduliflexus flocculans TaxID=1499966 RepID=A0A081BLE7_9BACT|nr:transcriptional regulator, RpiR family [Candidatus Moduliflexus flocculans]
MNTFEWAQRLQKARYQLTKREWDIVAYIEANFDVLHQYSMQDIVDATNTSRSTVHRFCEKLGYDGYKEFRDAMIAYHDTIAAAPAPFPTRDLTPKTASDAALSDAASAFDIFQKGLIVDMNALHNAVAMYSEAQIARITAMISNAKTIYCVGYETGAFMAQFIGERFSRLRKRMQIVTGESRRIKDLVFSMQSGDLIWLLEYTKAFDLYQGVVALAKQRGAATFLMTTYPTSPLIVRVDEALLVHRGLPNFKNSLAVPMTIVNSLQLAYEFEMGADKRTAALQEWDEFASPDYGKEMLDEPPPTSYGKENF